MIAIKDMKKMPKSCGKCPLCINEDYCYNVCVVLSTVLDNNTYKKTKHLNCPLVEVKDMKMPTKFHLIIPISISESDDKAPFVDFETNSEMISYLGKRVYIDSYETAVKNAKFLSKKYKIDIAVVEVKNIIEVK